MTTHRLFLLTVNLIAVLLTSSCAPAVTNIPATPMDTSIPVTATLIDTSEPEAATSAPTSTVEAQAVATSRGPDLEATDPTTVNLASGQLQLVEFFRFT